MLDLRLPSGFFFAITGATLVILGITSAPHAPMTDGNIDLCAGAVMLLFGAVLLLLAHRSRKA